jgi:septum site-determining protein MinC
MSVAPGGHASASFDLKSASLTAVSLVLKTPDLLALEADMQQRWGDTPDFFNHDAVVIDLSALAGGPAKVAFATLIPLLPDASRCSRRQPRADASSPGGWLG